MTKTGRIIVVQAQDLRIGDVFANDGCVIQEITQVQREIDATPMMVVSGVSHGIHKEGAFKWNEEVKLWQKFA